MFANHHIITQAIATNFSNLLNTLGVNVNDSANIIPLPTDNFAAAFYGVSPHTGGHLSSYTNGVRTALGDIQEHITANQNSLESIAQGRAAYDALQQGIKVGLL